MQADLGLCCPHMPEDTFLHDMAHLKYTAKNEATDAAQMMTEMMSILLASDIMMMMMMMMMTM